MPQVVNVDSTGQFRRVEGTRPGYGEVAPAELAAPDPDEDESIRPVRGEVLQVPAKVGNDQLWDRDLPLAGLGLGRAFHERPQLVDRLIDAHALDVEVKAAAQAPPQTAQHSLRSPPRPTRAR
jgi:hypothetical protein